MRRVAIVGGLALAVAACGGSKGALYDFSETKACLEAHKALVLEQGAKQAAMGDGLLPPGIQFEHVAEWAFPFGGSTSVLDRGVIVFERNGADARQAGKAWRASSQREVAAVHGRHVLDLRKYLTVERNVLVTWENPPVALRTRELVLGCLR